MPSPGMRGWYVEVDEQLMALFDREFPENGAKVKLTVAAIRAALYLRSLVIGHTVDDFLLRMRDSRSRDFLPAEAENVSRERGNEGKSSVHGGVNVSNSKRGTGKGQSN